MYYAYILLSSKSHIFYFGSAKDLKLRFKQHNNGEVKSTKPHFPWKLVWYAGFETEKQARDFEQYLKSGSGKAFSYKRLVSAALEKDFYRAEKVVRNHLKPQGKDDEGYQARQQASAAYRGTETRRFYQYFFESQFESEKHHPHWTRTVVDRDAQIFLSALTK